LQEIKDKLAESRLDNDNQLTRYLRDLGYEEQAASYNALELVRRPHVETRFVAGRCGIEVSEALARQLDIELKFEGYIAKARREAANLQKMESQLLPADLDYTAMANLSLEARQKLQEVKPLTMGQASRISGVNPADIITISIYLRQMKGTDYKEENEHE
ncbi:MAG: tRNA uridine-5-carboxymethylaminomethyl(34) synthesis enzyme MnmG, partial [Erysipelotrichaceae bacterium]|nr:tRNA uridine-5-carboxymethylaminomethyl(34) synthesis enzyme MnmG [Erysipelotrichaceae bacterium]